MGKPINEWTDDYGSKATKKKTYIGKVTNYFKKIKVAEIKLEAEQVKVGSNILIIGPTTGVHEQKVESLEVDKNKKTKVAKKGQIIGIKVSKYCRKNDKVFLFE
jgi:putative protease